MSQTYFTTALQGTPLGLSARVSNLSGTYITQSSVASMILTTTDLISGVSNTATIDKTITVFNTLQTDSRWTIDSTGGNVFIILPASHIPVVSTYRATLTISTTDGYPLHIVWQIETEPI